MRIDESARKEEKYFGEKLLAVHLVQQKRQRAHERRRKQKIAVAKPDQWRARVRFQVLHHRFEEGRPVRIGAEWVRKPRGSVRNVVDDCEVGVSNVGDFGVFGEDDGADEGVERVEDFETVGLDEDFVGVLWRQRRNGETNIGFDDGGGEGQERTREKEKKKRGTK